MQREDVGQLARQGLGRVQTSRQRIAVPGTLHTSIHKVEEPVEYRWSKLGRLSCAQGALAATNEAINPSSVSFSTRQREKAYRCTVPLISGGREHARVAVGAAVQRI